MNELNAQRLTCERGDRVLFRDLSFRVGMGEVLHVCGNNGAGKSSLLAILCGLLVPQAGCVLWESQPVSLANDAFKQALGYIGHQAALIPGLSVAENCQTLMNLAGIKAALPLAHALSQMQLCDFINEDIQSLSRGQQQRLMLCFLLMKPAKIWILDEPFSALDSKGCDCLIAMMTQFIQSGGMVVLSSHQSIPFRQSIRQLQL